MWPWEHLAVGYLVVSLWARASGRRPLAPDIVAIAVGSQFPDLVDKPLGWGTTLLPSGTSLAHSLVVALPLAAAVVVLGRISPWPTAGVAFALSYLAHLPADAMYPVVLGDDPKLAFVLWPLVPVEPTPPTAVIARVGELFVEFLAVLTTPAGALFLVAEAALLGGVVLLWRADGSPGLELVSQMNGVRTR